MLEVRGVTSEEEDSLAKMPTKADHERIQYRKVQQTINSNGAP